MSDKKEMIVLMRPQGEEEYCKMVISLNSTLFTKTIFVNYFVN